MRRTLLLIAGLVLGVVLGRRRGRTLPSAPLPPVVDVPSAPLFSVAEAPSAPPRPVAAPPPAPAPVRAAAAPPPRRRRRRGLRIALGVAGGVVLIAAAGAIGLGLYADSIVGEFSAGAKGRAVADAREVLGTDPVATGTGTVAEAEPAADDVLAEEGAAATSTEAPATTAGAATTTLPTARLETVPAKPRAAETFLLIGADRRVGEGEEWGRSDTLILVRLDHERDAISMLSIPRDLMVEIPGFGQQKINGAYALGGPRLAIETVRDAFQVRIDHFLVIDFLGFARAIDALGGVELAIDQRYFNQHDGTEARNYAEIDLHPGYQRLTGRQALDYVRYRHTDSTDVREQRQQLFLHELRRTLGDASPTRLLRTLRPTAKSITSDIDDARTLVRIVRDALAVPPEHVARVALEAVPATSETTGASYYVASTEQIASAVAELGHPALTPAPDRAAAARRQRLPAVRPGDVGLGQPTDPAQPRRRRVPDVPEVEDDLDASGILPSVAPPGLRVCVPTLAPAGAYRTPPRRRAPTSSRGSRPWPTRRASRPARACSGCGRAPRIRRSSARRRASCAWAAASTASTRRRAARGWSPGATARSRPGSRTRSAPSSP